VAKEHSDIAWQRLSGPSQDSWVVAQERQGELHTRRSALEHSEVPWELWALKKATAWAVLPEDSGWERLAD
jgi:hypothetical protein